MFFELLYLKRYICLGILIEIDFLAIIIKYFSLSLVLPLKIILEHFFESFAQGKIVTSRTERKQKLILFSDKIALNVVSINFYRLNSLLNKGNSIGKMLLNLIMLAKIYD